MGKKRAGDKSAKYLPTPEEIRAECEKILAALTPEELLRRRVQKPVPHEVQTYRLQLPEGT